MKLSVLELCAGGGGQALGLETAGYESAAVVEIDEHACATLRENRPGWRVLQLDVKNLKGRQFRGIDLLAAGVPCPPFSVAGKQLGPSDDRDLFPATLDLIADAAPRAVLIENVPGFASPRFDAYRKRVISRLNKLKYVVDTWILNARDFGVPQLRPRFVLVAMRSADYDHFSFNPSGATFRTVGDTIGDLMGEGGWPGVNAWVSRANGIAPTLVGGSKRHGGPDLGPTRAKRQWRTLGVDGMGIADAPPTAAFSLDGLPRLTLRMAARIQGFDDSWIFKGGKTAAYRQIGNAFPPPVAAAVGQAIGRAIRRSPKRKITRQLVMFAYTRRTRTNVRAI